MRFNKNLLRAVITVRGMEQKDLAKQSGISRATINAICNGKSCSPDTARKIAEALDVDLQDICEREEGDQ